MTLIFTPESLHTDIATFLFNSLKDEVKWENGIRSKKGFTRKAFAVPQDSPLMEELMVYVTTVLEKMETKCAYAMLGIYLNYYQNGEMYTPSHKHPGTHQLIISLGTTRTLKVGSKSYPMKNGDSILFDSQLHSVPKESSVVDGRISIATFMLPMAPMV